MQQFNPATAPLSDPQVVAMHGIPPIVPGSVARIYKNEPVSNPHLQLIFAKAIDNDTNGQPRWKLALSDSVHFIQAVGLSPINPLFEQNIIEPGDVIKITKYSMASLKGRYLMLIGDIDASSIVKVPGGGKIGNPTNVETEIESPAVTAAPPAPAAPVYAAPPAYNPAQTWSNPAPLQAPPMPQQYVQPAVHQQSAPTYNGRPAGLATSEQPYVKSWNNPGNPTSNNQNFNSSNTVGGVGGGNYQQKGNNYAGQGPAFLGGNQQFQPQQAQMTGDDAETIYTPICGLSPYQNTFTIKARCTFKSEVRTWAKDKSSGKLFSVNLIDNTGEIKMTGFKDTVDKFYDMFTVGQVYSISGLSVKMANKRYSNLKGDYELFLEGNSQVQLLADNSLPAERFNFVPINSLSDFQKDEIVDIIGVAHDVGELGSITVKSTGKQLNKRDVTLVDTTGHSVRVTLWGKEAEEFSDFKNRAVIAIKAARVSDFNGRTLSTLSSSVVSVNPDIKESHELRGWYDSTGYSQSLVSMSVAGQSSAAGNAAREERKLIAQIKEENLGQFEKPDYINIVATCTYFKSDGNLYYPACPTEDCNKKVIEDGPNLWRCERCQKVSDRCEYRYILSCQVSDESGQTWLNVFNETGAALLGVTADELHRLKLEDEEAFKRVFEKATLKPFLFKLRVKQEQYQGEAKIRNTVVSATPVNYAEESKRLIAKIEQVL